MTGFGEKKQTSTEGENQVDYLPARHEHRRDQRAMTKSLRPEERRRLLNHFPERRGSA